MTPGVPSDQAALAQKRQLSAALKALRDAGFAGAWTDFYTGERVFLREADLPIPDRPPSPEAFGIDESRLERVSDEFKAEVARLRQKFFYRCFPGRIRAAIQRQPRLANFGRLLEAVRAASYWSDKAKAEYWSSLDGYSFQDQVAKLYERLGYNVETGRKSNDGGIDIVLHKDGETTIVQCKAHKKPVGPAVVRELFGVLNSDERFHRAIIVAAGGASPGAHEFAARHSIAILSVDELAALQMKALADVD